MVTEQTRATFWALRHARCRWIIRLTAATPDHDRTARTVESMLKTLATVRGRSWPLSRNGLQILCSCEQARTREEPIRRARTFRSHAFSALGLRGLQPRLGGAVTDLTTGGHE